MAVVVHEYVLSQSTKYDKNFGSPRLSFVLGLLAVVTYPLAESAGTICGMKQLAGTLVDNADSPVPERCRVFHLNSLNIGDEGIVALVKSMGSAQKAKKLFLHSNQISDRGVAAIAKLFRKEDCEIDTLVLSNNAITAIGVRELAEGLAGNKKLRVLALDNNTVADDGAIALADALLTNTALKSITLSNASIGDNGARALATVVAKPDSAIEELNLDGNYIGYPGAKSLADAIGLHDRPMKVLNLKSNFVDDLASVAFGRALATNVNLEKLHLDNNKIGNEGAKGLFEGTKCHMQLAEVTLSGNSISLSALGPIVASIEANKFVDERQEKEEVCNKIRARFDSKTSSQVSKEARHEEL
jgi:Ran GTPase-activating protein (RanGAP) involved in mRNA processing and transport